MVDPKHPSDIPRMVPDRDDIRSRQQQQSKRQPDAVKPKASVGTSSVAPRPAQTPWVLIVFLLIVSVAVVYLALQQYSTQQLINAYEERLSIADERIVTLEQALTQTDESVAMNETALNAQFKAIKAESDMQMSEIRKLWDVANKRNREWIEANQEAVKQASDSIAAVTAQTNRISEQVSTVQASMTSLNSERESDLAALTQLNTQMQDQNRSMETLSSSLAEIGAQLESVSIEDIQEQIISLTLAQENLLAEQGDLANNDESYQRQLSDMQQSINAIDASRLELNRRLVALNAQLDDVNARLTSIAGPGQ